MDPTPGPSTPKVKMEVEVYHPKIGKHLHDKFLQDQGFLPDSVVEHGMGEIIPRNSVQIALGGQITTPDDFYVILSTNWNLLEKAMAIYQKEYHQIDLVASSKGQTNPSIPWKGHLLPGYIVAAFCHIVRDEFHRAKILEILPDDQYKVRLLDYGDIITVAHNDLRYMRSNHFYMMRSQAIRCRVRLNCVETSATPWTLEDGHRFREMIFDKLLVVQFKRMSYLETGELVWDVALHLYSDPLHKIKSFHVERQLVEKSGRVLTLTKEEQEATLTHPNVRLTLMKESFNATWMDLMKEVKFKGDETKGHGWVRSNSALVRL